MSQLMDYAGYLVEEIGPRPAGTEEEQRAALYITEQFQKEAGFTANIEEFNSSSNFTNGRAILAVVMVVVTVLAMIFPVLNIPAFILGCAAAVIYALEETGRTIISRYLSHDVSQNVVAKYQPNFEESMGGGRRGRSRKVVLVAHYDTGRVTPTLVERLRSTGLPLPLACVVAMAAAAFFLLIRIFVAPGGGMGLLVLNVLSIIALLVCLLPIVHAVLMARAAYNEGANNNATGTAALIEVARRISRGSVSEADLAEAADDDVRIHGEQAAREAGLIPEGAQIRYEAEQLTPPAELGAYDDEERLLAAKAAIAAFTGMPVERKVYGSVADKLVNTRADGSRAEYADKGTWDDGGRAFAPTPHSDDVAMPAQDEYDEAQGFDEHDEADGFENAPSWFVSAQQNAKKAAADHPSEPVEIQRSKYTEAIEGAERERAERMREADEAEQAQLEEARRQREQEVRAALEASAAQKMRAAQMAIDEAAYEAEPAAAEDFSVPRPAAQSPDSTIAMAAPVPASEILAEAHAELQQAEPVAVPQMSLPVVDDHVQLDQGDATRGRIADLPPIDSPSKPKVASVPEIAPTTNPSRSGLLRRLRTSVPSLSGLINPIPDSSDASSAPDDNASRATRRSVAKSVPNVVEVPDVAEPAPSRPSRQPDAFEVPEVASSQPVAAPVAREAQPQTHQFEVPRSRAGSLLSRRKSSDDMTQSPQEWLDVDDNFDARTVGRERGGWESFRDDQYFDDDAFDDVSTSDGGRRSGGNWQGGAYSRMQLGHVNMLSGAEEEEPPAPMVEPMDAEAARSLTGEIEQIYHFRNPLFNNEVWFVAMGADGENHNGVRAFLDEHHDELRGAMVIEVESLGAGQLSVAKEEGRVRKVNASSRVKRFARKAVASTGIVLDEVSLAGTDSIASIVQEGGFQAMHLFGAEDGRPALKGSADDVLENIDELAFDDNVNFIFELLKS